MEKGGTCQESEESLDIMVTHSRQILDAVDMWEDEEYQGGYTESSSPHWLYNIWILPATIPERGTVWRLLDHGTIGDTIIAAVRLS